MRGQQSGSVQTFCILTAAAIGAVWAAPAQAQKPPEPVQQEILIKTTLLTFNDANLTQNYSVLHSKLSKQFRDQFSPDRLKEVFKPFVEQKIDSRLYCSEGSAS